MTLQLPTQSFTAWRVCLTILHCVAITFSAVRICLRYRRGRMWWDDYLVVFPVLFDIVCCIALSILPPPSLSLESISKASNFWLTIFPSFSVVWLSRICFLLLLARLFPPGHIYRRITFVLTAIFLSFHITLIAWNIPRCDGVHLIPPPLSLGKSKNCKLPTKIDARKIFGLTVDLLSDLILVVWPLIMLYKVNLSRAKDRPLVIISLGCSIFTCLLVLTITILTFGPVARTQSYYIVVRMLAHIAAAVSLIACNMPIVACAAYRAFQKTRGAPQGSVVSTPDASTIPTDGSRSGTGLSSSSSASKVYTTGDDRFTYDDLTRISMSFDMDEVVRSQLTTTNQTNLQTSQEVDPGGERMQAGRL